MKLLEAELKSEGTVGRRGRLRSESEMEEFAIMYVTHNINIVL
jgi:hypothetical protein